MKVDYLRLSITDRCNLRCSYCMPPEGVPPRAHDEILSYEELAAVARVALQWSEQYVQTIPAAGVWCDGCMTGGERRCGHVDECKIRACVVDRGLSNCAGCDDYVCGMLEEFLVFAAESVARETLASLRAGS